MRLCTTCTKYGRVQGALGACAMLIRLVQPHVHTTEHFRGWFKTFHGDMHAKSIQQTASSSWFGGLGHSVT